MRLLIIEDHAVVREGVRKLLSQQFNAEMFEADSSETGMKAFETEKPDLTILDLNLEKTGGLEILRKMMAQNSKANILIFTTHSEPVYAARALRAGARGYVTKSAAVEELIAAVKACVTGEKYIDRDVAARLALQEFQADDPLQRLSTRELEILRKLGSGSSLSEIAENLGIAYKTVANTCSQIKVKLGVERTADLIRFSLENLQS